MKLRSVFFAGCVALSLPGLAALGFHAASEWAQWRAAQSASLGAAAAGEAMRAASQIMLERGAVQEASFRPSAANAAQQAAVASDAALARAEFAFRRAGFPVTLVAHVHEMIAAIRERTAAAEQKHGSLRSSMEQYARAVEELNSAVTWLEREVTLANPSVGLALSLAQNAGELRAVGGRRGNLLQTWLGGEEIGQAQKEELLTLNGRLAGAWDRLVRNVRAHGAPVKVLDAIAQARASFFAQHEPWYREMVRAAMAGADRPITLERFRVWTVKALGELLPLRDLLIAEASVQGESAMRAAARDLIASGLLALLSLGLIGAALRMLLREVIEPVGAMTSVMRALASGDLSRGSCARNHLDEISTMSAAISVFRENLISLHQREFELGQINLRFTAALDNMTQGLAMYDADERLAVFNRRFCDVLGLPPDRVRHGMRFREVVALGHEMGIFPRESMGSVYAERRRQVESGYPGSTIEELSGGRAVAVRYHGMEGGGWVSTFEDVTDRRAAEARIRHMAHHDALTGLPNRVLFREHAERALTHLCAADQAAVLLLDLDGFKGVNDTFGHPAGDELLQVVATRLRRSTRESEFVARLGGDEFAILQRGVQEPEIAGSLADRLVAALSEPFRIQGSTIEIGTSIGIVLADGAGSTVDEMLRNADMALYQAKAAGRGTWRFFEPSMEDGLQERRTLESRLRLALAGEQFEVHYQPLVKAETRSLCGFEALLRWRDPERGLISPALFIPIAEETGLIRQIGSWVLNRACIDAATWPNHVKLAVNLSPVQFARCDLVQTVTEALHSSGLAPSRLELEITESVLLQDNQATLETLRRIRKLGVSVSMDDFGTGYSSLSYLRRFPFDKIKIDQSFVKSLEQQGSIEIVRAVVGLSKALGMTVLAEGVETERQLSVLESEGCDELQGYLFSPPLPPTELRRLIDELARSEHAGMLECSPA